MPLRLHALACAALLALCAVPPATAQYVAEDEALYLGSAVPLAHLGDTLVVTYRPNSSIARMDTLVGAQAWTPLQAGVVNLQAPGGEAQSVSVRFRETPISGLFVLIGAGLILFGGAAFAFKKLFEGGRGLPPA